MLSVIQQLQELEVKYSECIEMLHEAQEELKNLRNRNYPAGTPRRYHPLGLYPMVRVCVYCTACLQVCVRGHLLFLHTCFHVLQDSLAAEIEGTMRKELSLDDPDCEEQKYEGFTYQSCLTYFLYRVTKNYNLSFINIPSTGFFY